MAYARLRHLSEDTDTLEQLLKEKPDYAEAYGTLGWVLHEQGRFGEAVEVYQKGLGYKAAAAAHRGLADVYAHLGRFPEAEKEFREALWLKPNHDQADVGLVGALYAQKRVAEAVFRQAVQVAPQDTQWRIALGTFLAHTGKAAEAEALYRAVLQEEPDHPLALNNLGYAPVERNERLDEALEMIQRAVRAEPNNPSFLDSLGWAHFKLGKLEEAERHLVQATQSEPRLWRQSKRHGSSSSCMGMLKSRRAGPKGRPDLCAASRFGDRVPY